MKRVGNSFWAMYTYARVVYWSAGVISVVVGTAGPCLCCAVTARPGGAFLCSRRPLAGENTAGSLSRRGNSPGIQGILPANRSKQALKKERTSKQLEAKSLKINVLEMLNLKNNQEKLCVRWREVMTNEPWLPSFQFICQPYFHRLVFESSASASKYFLCWRKIT